MTPRRTSVMRQTLSASIANTLMRGHMRDRSTLLCAAVALLGAGASVAEPVDLPGGGTGESESLTVDAPPVHRRLVDGRRRGSTEIVFITHRVSYAGLDLAMHAGVVELRRRIAESAQAACKQLPALAPLADFDTASCVRDAIRDATERADRVIAMAIVEHEFASAL
jgi:UrcA family protein